MEQVYALGVICIKFVQEWFKDSGDYFETMNNLSNPHHAFEFIFPVVSIFDSVFAAQFLLCISFGSWLNAIIKWWLLEDRPYWWIRETTFYDNVRPRLLQTDQTCETGPGSPSGHTTLMAMQLVLYVMWISHFMNDRNCYVWWWKYIVYPVFGVVLVSVMLARMYVAAHFPHQCLLGALIGLFLAPALCIYVSDPHIWPGAAAKSTKVAVFWHVMSSLVAIATSFFTYWTLKVLGIDPQWSTQLAFRWCERPDTIHVSSTPMYALVQSTASLLAWAACVTPQVAQYRHYTQRRSLIVAALTALGTVYFSNGLKSQIDTKRVWFFYAMLFVIYLVKSVLLLRVVPFLAMAPYGTRGTVMKSTKVK